MESINIAEKYVDRLNKMKDPIAVTVVNHLYIEYWIDEILKSKLKNPSKFIKSKYPFKVELLYNFDLIPEGLYQNLMKFNKLRNNCAHDLNYNFEDVKVTDYNLETIQEDVIRFLENEDVLLRLHFIVLVTFNWLHIHAMDLLNLK